MAKSEIIYWKGKGKWCQRLFVPDDRFDPPSWNFDFYPDKDAYAELIALKEPKDSESQGLLNSIKKDDDGYYVRIKRPLYINTRKGRSPLTAPVIVNADNTPWDHGVSIGNGSDLTVKIEKRTYPTPTKKKGVAIRLVGARVDNLVPFERDDFPKGMDEAVAGLIDQPKPNW